MKFNCNTSAKNVTPVQITHRTLDYDWLKDNRKFSKPMVSCKMMANICVETLNKDLPALPPRDSFRVYIINN